MGYVAAVLVAANPNDASRPAELRDSLQHRQHQHYYHHYKHQRFLEQTAVTLMALTNALIRGSWIRVAAISVAAAAACAKRQGGPSFASVASTRRMLKRTLTHCRRRSVAFESEWC
jgi:hypothetical protein